MSADKSWTEMRDRRMTEPGADDAYEAVRLAFELGAEVRRLRESKDWSQAEFARASGMTQSAVARFEAGGTVPTLTTLYRLARTLDAELVVRVSPRSDVA